MTCQRYVPFMWHLILAHILRRNHFCVNILSQESSCLKQTGTWTPQIFSSWRTVGRFTFTFTFIWQTYLSSATYSSALKSESTFWYWFPRVLSVWKKKKKNNTLWKVTVSWRQDQNCFNHDPGVLRILTPTLALVSAENLMRSYHVFVW